MIFRRQLALDFNSLDPRVRQLVPAAHPQPDQTTPDAPI